MQPPRYIRSYCSLKDSWTIPHLLIDLLGQILWTQLHQVCHHCFYPSGQSKTAVDSCILLFLPASCPGSSTIQSNDHVIHLDHAHSKQLNIDKIVTVALNKNFLPKGMKAIIQIEHFTRSQTQLWMTKGMATILVFLAKGTNSESLVLVHQHGSWDIKRKCSIITKIIWKLVLLKDYLLFKINNY